MRDATPADTLGMHMIRSRRGLVPFALLLAASPLGSTSPAQAGGTTYHVAVGGGRVVDVPGTETQPWGSIKEAIAFRVEAGDTLIVHGGDYYEVVGWRRADLAPATASNPIRVLAAPGERPVIHGVVNLERPSHWLFDGINITRDPARPIDEGLLKIRDGVNWTYRNAEIWGGEGVSNVSIRGTRRGEPGNWRFTGNCVHDVGDGPRANNYHNMYVTSGYTAGVGVIERNLFFNVPNGNHIKAGPNSETGASNLKIRYNTMFKGSQGVLASYRTHHVSLTRNLIVKRWGGRANNPGIRGHELTNTTNIAADNMVWGFEQALLNTQASNGRIRNGGGNVKRNPLFDATATCNDFLPTLPKATAYGHRAP